MPSSTETDVSTPAGLQKLNDFLGDHSYIEGYQPSQADVSVFKALGSAPSAKYTHIIRWYNHLKSYQKEFEKLPGVQISVTGGSNGAGDAQEDDDDVDLFGSDEEEDAEAEKIREERLKAYHDKKSKKPALTAKSNVILDVKPWDDETDMAELEKCVRSVEIDGLKWGASKLVPVGYGIKKLQISSVIEDDKVSTDAMEEAITAFEDYIQSVDIAAFNKV